MSIFKKTKIDDETVKKYQNMSFEFLRTAFLGSGAESNMEIRQKYIDDKYTCGVIIGYLSCVYLYVIKQKKMIKIILPTTTNTDEFKFAYQSGALFFNIEPDLFYNKIIEAINNNEYVNGTTAGIDMYWDQMQNKVTKRDNFNYHIIQYANRIFIKDDKLSKGKEDKKTNSKNKNKVVTKELLSKLVYGLDESAKGRDKIINGINHIIEIQPSHYIGKIINEKIINFDEESKSTYTYSVYCIYNSLDNVYNMDSLLKSVPNDFSIIYYELAENNNTKHKDNLLKYLAANNPNKISDIFSDIVKKHSQSELVDFLINISLKGKINKQRVELFISLLNILDYLLSYSKNQ